MEFRASDTLQLSNTVFLLQVDLKLLIPEVGLKPCTFSAGWFIYLEKLAQNAWFKRFNTDISQGISEKSGLTALCEPTN